MQLFPQFSQLLQLYSEVFIASCSGISFDNSGARTREILGCPGGVAKDFSRDGLRVKEEGTLTALAGKPLPALLNDKFFFLTVTEI